MINLRCFRVPAERVPALRDWMRQNTERVEEVKVTMRNEGVTEEAVWMLPVDGSDDVILVYAVASADYAAALEVFNASTLPIDVAHRAAMQAAQLVRLPADEVFRAVVDT